MATVLTTWRRYPWAAPLLCAVVVLVLPQLGVGADFQRQVILVALLALLVSGLNLASGSPASWPSGRWPCTPPAPTSPATWAPMAPPTSCSSWSCPAAVAVVVGLLTGIPGLRLGSWSLAMTSFFLVLLIPDILQIFSGQTGGSLGLAGIAPPTLFGATLSRTGSTPWSSSSRWPGWRSCATS